MSTMWCPLLSSYCGERGGLLGVTSFCSLISTLSSTRYGSNAWKMVDVPWVQCDVLCSWVIAGSQFLCNTCNVECKVLLSSNSYLDSIIVYILCIFSHANLRWSFCTFVDASIFFLVGYLYTKILEFVDKIIWLAFML